MAQLELNDAAFHRISALMHGAVGLSFAASKKPLVSSRLSTRVQRLGLERELRMADKQAASAEAAELQV